MPSDSAPDRPSWRARCRAKLREKYEGSGLEQLSIRWRFRVVVLAFGLPFLGYIAWTAVQQAKIEKSHLRAQTQALARLVSTRLDDHIQGIDRSLAIAAHSIGANPHDLAGMTALLQRMRDHVPRSVDNIAVWSLTGQSIAALNPSTTTRAINVADRPYFREVLARRGLAIQAPVVSRVSGEDIALMARPIFDNNSQMVAVIAMSIRLKGLIDDLDPNDRLGNDTLVTVLDRSGTIITRSIDPTQWIGKRVEQLGKLNDAFAAGSGAREQAGVDGQIRLTGYSAASKIPWMVFVGEPIETATAPVSENLLKNLAMGIAVLVFAMLLAGRIAAWTVRPLLRLAADAERLGTGDLAHRSQVATGGEIATLAANFNRMAAALEERETALAASQRRMRNMAEHMPAQVVYIDTDERYQFVNHRIARVSPLFPDDMVGKTVREVRGEEMYRVVEPAMRRAYGGEEAAVEIAAVIDGSPAYVFAEYVPDRDADGTVRGIYAFTQDITERKTAELQLAESEKRLVTITDNLPAMICYVDTTRHVRFANRAFEKWLGRPVPEIVGRTFAELVPPDVSSAYDAQFHRCLAGEMLDSVLEVAVPHGRNRWLRSTFVPDFDERTGVVKGVYGMVHDVTAAKEAEQRLTRLAQFDSLTGLANRHQFNEKLAQALARPVDAAAPLALMFLDIDHFKQVNDRYGHASGDALLKEFARRLSECVRPTDAVARLAGDEFVVLLEGLHTEEEPQFIARKIIAAVQKPFTIEECLVRVTTSIGVAVRVFECEPSMLMKRADEALYEAKRAGRNTFRLAG